MVDATPPRDHSASATTTKKKRPPAVVAEIALYDPKRAQRIMTNRRSAMKAKQKKKMYVRSLEYKVECLHWEAAALYASCDVWQADSLYINADNQRLLECLNHVLQQIKLQDSLMEETKKEIQDLKKLVLPCKAPKD